MRKPANPLALKALEIIGDDLKEAEEETIVKVLHAITGGKFTPEMAMQKWYEIYAQRQVVWRLKRQNKRVARQAEAKPVDSL